VLTTGYTISEVFGIAQLAEAFQMGDSTIPPRPPQSRVNRLPLMARTKATEQYRKETIG